MKWTNKGHEFDKYAASVEKVSHNKFVLFGAGRLGKRLGKALDRFNLLDGFIDNDIQQQGNEIYGNKILSLDEYIDCNGDKFPIIVAVSLRFMDSIICQLENVGLRHGEDFWLYEEFINKILPVMMTYFYGKSYMRLAQITLTERCSLKCKKCAHACYNVSNAAEDMVLSEAFRSADSFFSKVDYIDEFVLIGGEPLLYRQLSEVIEYIGEKYREQMGIYCITTNGTIVPDNSVLKACKKYNVLFRISNYSKTLPRLKDSHKRLMAALDEYGIEYILGSTDGNWIDYGFDYLENDNNPDELIKTFDNCHTPCREVRGNKLYYCVMARSVSDNLNLNEGSDDFLDLNSLTGEDYKKILLEFNMGYSDKGYLDMCRRCHGMDSKNYPIPVAEQM